jgi:hypothetical protein
MFLFKRLVMLCGVLLLLQCSATVAKRSLGEVIDDTVIATKLKTRYIKDGVVDSKDIKVKVRKGVVQLSGVMTTQKEINRAIELAEKQRGVKEVKAYLVLKDVGELRPVVVGKHGTSQSKPAPPPPKTQQGHPDVLEEKDLTETAFEENL